MKFYLLIPFLILSSILFSHAQTERGNFQAGINIMQIPYLNGTKSLGFAAKFNLHLFVSKKVSFGLVPYVGRISQPITNDAYAEVRNYGIMLNNRYYMGGGKFVFFSDINFGIGNAQYGLSDISTNPQFEAFNGLSLIFSAGPGVNYALTDDFSIELTLPYFYMRNYRLDTNVERLHTIAPSLGVQFLIR